MYRAIIIDDEPKICNLIQMVGNWNALSIEVTATFCDSEDALAFILSQRPDIIITDIKMPVYDGLELIRMTREAGIDSAFIIISGYRHFEYAHQAMQFGIVDYLLKPVDQDELNATLGKICRNLTARRDEDIEKAVYNSLLAEKRQRQHYMLLKDLSQHKLAVENLTAFNAAYLTEFAHDCFRVLLLNTSIPQLHLSNASFQSKIESIALQTFTEHASVITVPASMGIFCFINYPASKSAVIFDDISRFFYSCTALSDIYGSFALSMGAGNEAASLSLLENSYLKAIEYEQAKLVLGWNRILSYLPESFAAPKPALVTDKELKNLHIYLNSLNPDGILQWFLHWQQQLAKDSFPDLKELYGNRDKILDFINMGFSDSEESESILMQTNCARNISDFITKLQNYVLTVVNAKITENSQIESLPIRQAKEYIKTHFHMSVTLEEVAEVVGYNPAYFSSSFKKYTGQNFSEYLTEVRIEEAKHLLKTSQLGIAEISEQAGYSDCKYFRKIFKKTVGIKPNDYRKLYT